MGSIPRLMTVDATAAACTVTCRCGFRALVPNRTLAAAVIDRHRSLMHPRQATYVASKRRARVRASRVSAG